MNYCRAIRSWGICVGDRPSQGHYSENSPEMGAAVCRCRPNLTSADDDNRLIETLYTYILSRQTDKQTDAMQTIKNFLHASQKKKKKGVLAQKHTLDQGFLT